MKKGKIRRINRALVLITFTFVVGTLSFHELKRKMQKTSSFMQYFHNNNWSLKVGLIALRKLVPWTYRIFCHPGAAYCKEYGLQFDASKSKIMVFSKSSIDHEKLSHLAKRPKGWLRWLFLTLAQTLSLTKAFPSHVLTILQSFIAPLTPY